MMMTRTAVEKKSPSIWNINHRNTKNVNNSKNKDNNMNNNHQNKYNTNLRLPKKKGYAIISERKEKTSLGWAVPSSGQA